MKKSKIIYSKIAPIPRYSIYWADLNEDPTGRTLKTFRNNVWKKTTDSITVEDLPIELITDDEFEEGLSLTKDYIDSEIGNADLSQVALNKYAISVLNGNDTGLSAREIVQDEVIKQLESENVSDSFDTLKEMAEYLSSHPQTVTDIRNQIVELNNDVIEERNRAIIAEGVLQEDLNSINSRLTVHDTVTEEIQSSLSTLTDSVNEIAEDYLTSDDKTELTKYTDDKVGEISLDGYATQAWVEQKIIDLETGGLDASVLATKSELAAVEAKIPSLNGYATEEWVNSKNYLTEHQDISHLASYDYVNGLSVNYDAVGSADKALQDAKKYTDEKVAEVGDTSEIESKIVSLEKAIESMDMSTTEGFVTSITQADGKIAVTTVDTISSDKLTIIDTQDHFVSTTVEQALAELADMWSWEEISD